MASEKQSYRGFQIYIKTNFRKLHKQKYKIRLHQLKRSLRQSMSRRCTEKFAKRGVHRKIRYDSIYDPTKNRTRKLNNEWHDFGITNVLKQICVLSYPL